MKELLKKEFSLCLHPTAFMFLAFALFVFIPNYPYEVMFFFSGLSAFFICLSARENGDSSFSCALPVKKSYVPVARIIAVAIFQCALVVIASVFVAVKECCMPAEMQINLAGNTANVAFIGYGFALLGVFNIALFPMHFKNPNKVGVPFVIAAVAVFVLIGLGVVLRWVAPIFADVLNTPDPQYIGVKLGVLFGLLAFYCGITALACYLSARNFVKVDL